MGNGTELKPLIKTQPSTPVPTIRFHITPDDGNDNEAPNNNKGKQNKSW